MEKTSKGLIEYAEAQLGNPYWMGTFGQYASQGLLNYERGRFPKYYTAKDFEQQFGMKVHDCCGLVKAYMMCATPTSTPTYISRYDQDPRMLYESARVFGDTMTTFPKRKGYLVYDETLGHVGIYVGNDEVIEARGHAWGVVRTKLNSRPWRKWSDYWAVSYGEESDKVKFSDIREVRKGNTGEEVRVVQAVVGVEVDGIFGAKTDAAVRKYQSNHKLVADGIVGEKTWKSIIEGWYV